MFQIIAYIKFLLKSKNQHGVHSPFVFDLVTNCFYNKKPQDYYFLLKKHRNLLYQDNRVIHVTDFGSGSRVFSSNRRKVSKIAKIAGVNPKKAKLLARLVRYLTIETVLELGTSVGLGTSSLHIPHTTSITTLEGCPETAKVAQEYFSKLNFTDITLLVDEFQKSIPKIENSSFDLIYFDGNHNEKDTLSYFETLVSLATHESIFIFDDIHWSKSMETAWKKIKSHSKVSITIDTFHFGFVFFRKEHKEKEHFVIRL
ncbi:MAG: class I SAM-dependent methyltransferase [Flavobacteriaceae bacterium]|nr:class I SAM-dependent methyltransferase [Flavobacteriaceae bacterium]